MTIPIPPVAHATFEPDGRAAAAARSHVRETLREWRLDGVVDDAVLLVSELVTNAIVHAGTPVEVTCRLLEGAVQVHVQDRHPSRALPEVPEHEDLEGASGRGLLLAAAIASLWGVTYTTHSKEVWFRLTLPDSSTGRGTTLASPIMATSELPTVPHGLHVAVVGAELGGRVREWNEPATALFGWTAEESRQLRLADLLAWPNNPALELDEVLELARWQGECRVRHRDGHLVAAFASHVRTRGAPGEPAVVWLFVHSEHRAILEVPAPARVPVDIHHHGDHTDDVTEWAILSDQLAARLSFHDLLQRTVERARDALRSDAAYVLLASDDDTEFELQATTGLPGDVQRRDRIPAVEAATRVGSANLPAVHEDLGPGSEPAPLLRGTGMRSLITVPLLVEGRVTGTLGVAAKTPGHFTNDDAIRLQRAADRIALSLERARLAEQERANRDRLGFLAEASDLLAGTLHQDMTMALVAQLVVPRLATWCAIHTVDENDASQLSYVWHADETLVDPLRTLLDKAPAPEPGTTPGVQLWSGLEALLLAAPGSSGSDSGGAPDEEGADDMLAGDIVLTFPLVARGRALGSLTFGRPAADRFPRESVALAEDLSRRAALALDNSRLYSELADTASALQESLLPPQVPDVPGLDIGVVYKAAGEGNEVGGDFYDIFPTVENRWRFAIGDVCGTGPEAAAVTGLARHTLRMLAREGYSVPDVLERLNTAILDEGQRSRFITLLYGELAPRQDGGMRVCIAAAGHPLPVRLRPDGSAADAAEPQPLLGVMPDLEFEEQVFDLDPDDVLVCVTDGVTERREGDRLLGDGEGLQELVATCTGLTAGAVGARLQKAVVDFASKPPGDDMAILVLRTL